MPQSEKRVLAILRRWDYLCLICGEPFKHIYTCSQEHIIPTSLGGSSKLTNIAPAHYFCNHLRGNNSLIDTIKYIDNLKQNDYQLFQYKIKEISFQRLAFTKFGIKISTKPSNDNKPIEYLNKGDTRNLIRHYQTNCNTK